MNFGTSSYLNGQVARLGNSPPARLSLHCSVDLGRGPDRSGAGDGRPVTTGHPQALQEDGSPALVPGPEADRPGCRQGGGRGQSGGWILQMQHQLTQIETQHCIRSRSVREAEPR